MATRTRTSRRSSVRRPSYWARETHSINPIPAGGDAQLLLQDASNELGLTAGRMPPGTTIGGMRFNVRARNTVASGDQSGLVIGFIVSGVQNSIEVPRPFSDPHADWMAYYTLFYGGAAVNASLTISESDNRAAEVNSKRRLDEIGMRLWIVAEPIQGVDAFAWQLQCSTLLLR